MKIGFVSYAIATGLAILSDQDFIVGTNHVYCVGGAVVFLGIGMISLFTCK
jgi:hypothetical protein